MKKFPMLVLGLAMASTANAATVTYTLSRQEGPTGLSQYSSFIVYASVAPGTESFGLFNYGVDLGTAPGAPPVNFAVTQRAPAGVWNADNTDPNWNPSVNYPTKVGGFTNSRATSPTGAVTGAMDASAYDPDPASNNLIVVKGIGQTAGNMTTIPAPTWTNPDGSIVHSKPFAPLSDSDSSYGFGRNNAFSQTIPAGSVRLFTGTICSGNPADLIIEPTPDTKAGVFKNNSPNDIDTETNNQTNIQYRTWSTANVGPQLNVSAAPSGANQAAGGAILVSGSNNHYASEVDPLLDPGVGGGSAAVQSIGDESGSLWVMAKLNGCATDVSGLQSNTSLNSGPIADPATAAALHASYDPLFGDGGFNLLYRQSNYAGPKNVNWSFGFYPTVTVDQMAVVPEPGVITMALAVAMMSLRRNTRDAR